MATKNQLEYQKQVKRIEGAVRRLNKQGYSIEANELIGTTPKRITQKKIKELKKITKGTILKDVSRETFSDEIDRAIQENRKQIDERVKKAKVKKGNKVPKAPAEIDTDHPSVEDNTGSVAGIILSRVFGKIDEFINDPIEIVRENANRLQNDLMEFCSEQGIDEVAKALDDLGENAVESTTTVIFSSTQEIYQQNWGSFRWTIYSVIGMPTSTETSLEDSWSTAEYEETSRNRV